MPFVIIGESNGQRLYWRKWTSASIAGRPKWVNRLSLKCLFTHRTVAEKTLNGTGSQKFDTTIFDRFSQQSTQLTNVRVEEIDHLPD